MTEKAIIDIQKLALAEKRNFLSTMDGKMTVFSLKIKPKSIAYRYNVEIVKPAADRRPEKRYTKQNDAGMRTAQREVCADIIEALHGMTSGFGCGAKYVYDGKANLFTNQEICLPNQKITVPSAQLKRRAAIFVKNEPVDVILTPSETSPKIDYSDLGQALMTDLAVQPDHSVRMFLEVLTNQFLLNSGQYSSTSSGTLFENRATPLCAGCELRVGFKKGVRITADTGTPTALMVVDMKKSAFVAQKKVSEIYREFLQTARTPQDAQRKFERHMKGVRVVVDYDPSRTFVVDRLTRFNVNNQQYSVQGKSLPNFVYEKHQIRIAGDAPGLHPQQPNGQKIVYPMECVSVLHGQLVPLQKSSEQMCRSLLLENSVAPQVRYTYVLQQTRAIATGPAADFLLQFGVKIDVDSNAVKIHQRATPHILYGKKQVVRPQANGSWFREAVDAPLLVGSARLKKWIVAHDQSVNRPMVESFVNAMIAKSNRMGMNVPPPQQIVATNLQQLQALFEEHHGRLQFLLYVDDHFVQSHKRLKLFEAYYKASALHGRPCSHSSLLLQILTQQVVAKNLRGGPQLMSNVVMKLNSKCFGLNYVPQCPASLKDFDLQTNKDLLVVGLNVVHPDPMDPKELFMFKKKHPELFNISFFPPVVTLGGDHSLAHPPDRSNRPCFTSIRRWSAWRPTSASEPYAFAGDFYFQEANRQEMHPPSLCTAIAQAVEQAVQSGRRPTRLIVLRDGLSEGQLTMAAGYELPAIRDGWRRGIAKTPELANTAVKITFVVCTKMHQKRFYRQQGANITNTQPGDVVDSKGHFPLKGVPKAPQYSVLVNELGMSMEAMQGFMLLLSNAHQVCACPTSLPAPVYVAHETAKRGNDVYHELFLMRKQRPHPNAAPAEAIRMDDGMLNQADLTRVLCYANSKLATTPLQLVNALSVMSTH
ncbi:hypothetical protein M3Y99_01966800 [Aphelenchoides fujianensis]|nr:hypothetical protein M3Y99_01966800 [Aphelenchoides fujianensis]